MIGGKADSQGVEKFFASQEEDVAAYAQSPAGLASQVAKQIVAQYQEVLAVFTEGNIPPDKIGAAIKFPVVAAGKTLAERCNAAIDRGRIAAMALQGAVAGGKAIRHLATAPISDGSRSAGRPVPIRRRRGDRARGATFPANGFLYPLRTAQYCA